jgi:hypothetical protein
VIIFAVVLLVLAAINAGYLVIDLKDGM